MFEVPFPSEKFIEDYVANYIDENGHCPITFKRADYLLRQFEISGYGKTDLIKVTADGNDVAVTILELKNEPLREAHVSQLARYMKGAARFLRHYQRLGYNISLLGELAGPFLIPASGDFVFLLGQLRSIDAYSLVLGMESGFVGKIIPRAWSRDGEKWASAALSVRDAAMSGVFMEVEFLHAKPSLELVKA